MSFQLILLALALLQSLAAAQVARQELERQFTQTVQPVLNTYCVGCHSGKNAAAQFDLRAYAALADTIRDHERWALAAEKMSAMAMPPRGMKQPSESERKQVIEWIDAMRSSEAKRNAGDPGLVLMRRLSNAEYNYSIRDLTGVDLRPAREFPVDPANPSGFDNSGESLAMSPALLNKYLLAAREVSTHLVLGAEGIRFAPHPMLAETDREKYTIQRIVDFYARQPTDYADYFEAAWKYKHRAALEKPNATLDGIAREAKLSAKYLPLVWEILEETREDVGPVARLQAMWRMLPGPEFPQRELVREGAIKMRDFVIHIRKQTARQFESPKVKGLMETSQPLMNWKLRMYAANRWDFDRTALQVEGEAPQLIPRVTSRDEQIAMRNRAIAVKARFGDPDLFVPAGQRARYEASFAKFSSVFPDAFYIRERGRFYPDDSEDKGRLLSAGFHNVMGYTRDDTPLMEKLLDEQGRKELEQLWMEFEMIADYTTRTYTQFYFNQSGEIEGRGVESGSFRPSDVDVTTEKVIYGIRDQYLQKAKDSEDLAKEAIREHFARVNAAIRGVEKARLDAEPKHLETLLQFAAKAYRRPLTEPDKQDLLAYYRALRDQKKLTHDDAMRDLVVLILLSPDFCYRVDLLDPQAAATPVPGVTTVSRNSKAARRPPAVAAKAASPEPVHPLSDQALASRLSYFLWSSLPDDELMAHATSGDLHQPEVLKAQVQRMLRDKKSLALATEFAGNWLGFRRFEDHNSVDRGRFPEFNNALRQAMFEEPVRFIDDAIRNGRSMLDLLYGKHTFVNRVLAAHYGIENLRFPRGSGGGEWMRVDDARPYGRGGILPMAVFLTRNSPGLRTSPVKRGYWVATQVLGEKIPPPPPSVPELPGDESKMNLPLRQMLAKHREHPSCAGCHQRFDGFGLAFEGYGPVGERRTKDLAGREVDTQAEFPGGAQAKGVDGLMDYIRTRREKDFVNNLCRKTLAYALERGLQLSDEPVVEEMRAKFEAGGYKFASLIESVVVSPQFLNQRSAAWTAQKEH